MDIEKTKLRYEEAIRIYRTSPQIQVTFADFANLYEDLINILENMERKTMGFK